MQIHLGLDAEWHECDNEYCFFKFHLPFEMKDATYTEKLRATGIVTYEAAEIWLQYGFLQWVDDEGNPYYDYGIPSVVASEGGKIVMQWQPPVRGAQKTFFVKQGDFPATVMFAYESGNNCHVIGDEDVFTVSYEKDENGVYPEHVSAISWDPARGYLIEMEESAANPQARYLLETEVLSSGLFDDPDVAVAWLEFVKKAAHNQLQSKLLYEKLASRYLRGLGTPL